MIKFVQPLSREKIDHILDVIAKRQGVTIRYIRPMSHGVHVIRVRKMRREPLDVAAFVRKVTARDDVVYIEMDRVVKHQRR